MSEKAGLTLSVDGEAEFKKALKEIGANLKVVNSELNLVTSSFGENENSIKGLSAKNDVLNKQIEEQASKVNTLQKALENSREIYGENSVKTKEWEAKLNGANAELNRQKQQIEANQKSIDDYGKAQIKAAKDSGEFKNAQDKLKGAFDLVKIALVGVIAGAAGFSAAALSNADELQALSDKTGLTAERLQELKYAGSNLGVELEMITGAQAKLTKSMAAVTDETKGTGAAFARLGIDVRDKATGELRDAKDVMAEAFDALNGMGNETERDALAMQIFGKSAMELNPLIKAGGDELSRLAEEARNSGAVMSNEAVAGLDTFGDSVENMKNALVGKFGEAFAALTPSLTELTDDIKNLDITPLVDGLQWIVDNADLVAAGAIAIGVGMVTWNVVTTVQALIGAIKTWQAATEGMTIAQGLLNLIMAANPIGIIITAIAALVAGIMVLWNTNDEFREAVIKMGTEIKDFFIGLIDWAQSIPGKFKAIGTDIVKGVWQGIKDMAAWFREQVSGFFSSIVDNVKDTLGINSPSKVFAGIGEYMAQGLGVGFEKAMTGVSKQINGSIPTDISVKSDYAIGEGIVNGLSAVMNNATSSGGTYIIQVVMDSKVVAQTIFDPLKEIALQKGVPA